MSWFTSLFQPSVKEVDDDTVRKHLREVFTGLQVKKDQLVSSKEPPVHRLRFLDLTNKLLLYKDEYTKEHAFQLEPQIKNVLQKIELFESSFKLFKFDDQQLLHNEKKVFLFLQKYVVNIITSILKTNIEKNRLSFLHQGKLVQNKFQQIQEFHKILLTQQEQADVETSIQTQREMEELFEQCVLLNAQRRHAASELLKELKTAETREKEKGEAIHLEHELSVLSEQCALDLEKLLSNFEDVKKQIQVSLDEKTVVRKQEHRLKASQIHNQKMEELAMVHEAAKSLQQKSFEELMKSVEDNKYVETSIIQNHQERERTVKLIETLQSKLLNLSEQKSDFEKQLAQIEQEKREVGVMLEDILEVSQRRVHHIEASVQVLKQTITCLQHSQTLATELDQYLTSKVEECDKLFRGYWKEALTEHVNLVCELWTFLQVRIQRKKKDIQHVASDLEAIKLQLQDATERENLTDVARFQKKKKKQEAVFKEVGKELERLMNKQGNTTADIHSTVEYLNLMNEPSYGAKIEALTTPTPSVL